MVAGLRDRADLDAVILHAIGRRAVVGPAQEKMAFIVHEISASATLLAILGLSIA
jgi:hypothetical protein